MASTEVDDLLAPFRRLLLVADTLRDVAPDAYDMSFDERHRTWWAEHERDRAFERRAALREHRRFCERYPEDVSCEGWYRP